MLLVPYYIRKAQGIPDPPPLREEDLAVMVFHVRSQPVHQGPRGVKIVHLPTELSAISTEARSQLENTAIALRELRRVIQEREL